MTSQQPNIQTKEGQAQLRELGIRVVPKVDDLTRPYWEAARRHELQVQRCRACTAYQHPPAEACFYCQSTDLQWTPLSGRGTVYTFIIDHRLMVPGFDEPYVVAQITPVETDDNLVRITANIKGCDLHDVYVGMPVEVFYEELTPEITLPQFRPVAANEASP
jgi:uncharacterized OB-fold protein